MISKINQMKFHTLLWFGSLGVHMYLHSSSAVMWIDHLWKFESLVHLWKIVPDLVAWQYYASYYHFQIIHEISVLDVVLNKKSEKSNHTIYYFGLPEDHDGPITLAFRLTA